MTARIPCSIGLLTLNSGKHLVRCLQSIKDFEDVFLLDGNSTDDTIEIARKNNIPVYKQVDTDEKNVRIKNFTEMRQKVFALAKSPWILFLDSDEFLSDDLINEIKDALLVEDNLKHAFSIQKEYIIGDKRIEFCFNYPNYYPRLFRKDSGINFKSNKLVHEQICVPPDVRVTKMKYWVYSEIPATYKDCVKKDRHQLCLMRQSTFSAASFKSRPHSLKMSCIYFLRSLNILLKSFGVYLRHGYKESLPIGHVLRHVRVHMIMSYWRFVQFIFGRKSIERLATNH